MKSMMNTTKPETVNVEETVNLEELLDEAGFSFAVVDRCPDPACDLCAARGVPAAA